MGLPHALVLPYPAQGHVIPFMELSHCLVDHGFKITFVNTASNHERVVAAFAGKEISPGRIDLVSVPDGLEEEDGGSGITHDLVKLTEGFLKVMPPRLEELIQRSKGSSDEITCMIADQNMAWALEVARKVGVRAAAFWPASAAMLTTTLSIPKLITDGIIDSNGVPMGGKTFQFSPSMPRMNTANLAWNFLGDRGHVLFIYILNNTRSTIAAAQLIICNSFHEIEAPVFAYAPDILPVGPLRSGHRPGKLVGHFWPEDQECLTWLDRQLPGSVIYAAFGSTTIFDHRQFQALALGLQSISDRPFLWVVRPDLIGDSTDAYARGFLEGVGRRGKMVGWSPQHEVLAHPSVGCFISHCGWNSTIEGVSNGVPFLCWPFFADQFVNQGYICDVWRTGLKLVPDESGVVTREEIKLKVEEVLGDVEMKARAMSLKEIGHKSASKGGTSFENFNRFVAALKE
ncbi:hypothetical protein Cni_G10077 [Canna indica]|uniref:UDP-glycosyltransferase 83A1 n=1 Tax=Canna indica TaxID=4628 RepID=A0AAQ3K996_9LILI|nr:hypothetical protein Cni_G10077 [Canna indica]